MSYDPLQYWQERHLRQGDAYVGPAKGEAQQRRVFARELRQALLDQPFVCPDVLDYGCGVGRFRTALTLPGGCYTGVDLNPMAVAQLRAVTAHDLCAMVETAAEFLGRPPRRFDVAVAVTVLQHVPDADIAPVCAHLGACRRVVLIEDRNPEGHPPAAHMRFRSPEEYARLLGKELVGGKVRLIDAERPLSHWVGVFE